jgi:hypothetical protein
MESRFRHGTRCRFAALIIHVAAGEWPMDRRQLSVDHLGDMALESSSQGR